MLFTHAADPYPPDVVYYVRMYNNKMFTDNHPSVYRYIAHRNDVSLGWGFKVKGEKKR